MWKLFFKKEQIQILEWKVEYRNGNHYIFVMSDSTSYLKTESVNFKEIKKITQYEEQSEKRLKHFQKPVGQYNWSLKREESMGQKNIWWVLAENFPNLVENINFHIQ